MLKDALYLLCFLLITVTAEAVENLVSVDEIIDSIPKGWGYSKKFGDFDNNGNKDVVIHAHDSFYKENILTVLIERMPGKYEIALNSRQALSHPDPEKINTIRAFHSVFFSVEGDKIKIVANSNGSRLSESFTFTFHEGYFVLSRYELQKGNRCNNYTTTYYGWTEGGMESMLLNDFTLENFYNIYGQSIATIKDADPILKEQYLSLMQAHKNVDSKEMEEKVDRALVAYDDIGEKRCDPSDYMQRYLFLDSPEMTALSNNVAFFFEQTRNYEEAVYLLEEIVNRYPKRTVAYINLGDAYWGKGEKSKARQVYTIYVSQMRQKGKYGRIPQRVIDRIAVK